MSRQSESLAALVDDLSRPRLAGKVLGKIVDLPLAGALFAKAMRAPMRFTWLAARITRLHGWLLRHSQGRLRRSWVFAGGQPVISLTTVGRKSGIERSTAVACFTVDEKLCVAGMNLGRTTSPGWTHNLRANPDASVTLAGSKIAVRARRLTGVEATLAWTRWLELQPSARRFKDIAGREIPIFELERQ